MEQQIRVLIADDSSPSREGLRALLVTRPEVEVIGEVSDGREAVCLAEQFQPAVVLMDVRMPKMDGLRATWLIKSKWPQIRVVVLTLYSDLRDDARAAGADVFLVKGCPVDDLLAAVLEPSKLLPSLEVRR